MTTTQTLPSVSEILSEVKTHGVTLGLPIALAREVIAASEGTVTWCDAGDTWARLVPATPGVDYPAL